MQSRVNGLQKLTNAKKKNGSTQNYRKLKCERKLLERRHIAQSMQSPVALLCLAVAAYCGDRNAVAIRVITRSTELGLLRPTRARSHNNTSVEKDGSKKERQKTLRTTTGDKSLSFYYFQFSLIWPEEMHSACASPCELFGGVPPGLMDAQLKGKLPKLSL